MSYEFKPVSHLQKRWDRELESLRYDPREKKGKENVEFFTLSLNGNSFHLKTKAQIQTSCWDRQERIRKIAVLMIVFEMGGNTKSLKFLPETNQVEKVSRSGEKEVFLLSLETLFRKNWEEARKDNGKLALDCKLQRLHWAMTNWNPEEDMTTIRKKSVKEEKEKEKENAAPNPTENVKPKEKYTVKEIPQPSPSPAAEIPQHSPSPVVDPLKNSPLASPSPASLEKEKRILNDDGTLAKSVFVYLGKFLEKGTIHLEGEHRQPELVKLVKDKQPHVLPLRPTSTSRHSPLLYGDEESFYQPFDAKPAEKEQKKKED